MQATYDEKADALSLTLLERERARTVQVAPGILAHFDRDKHLLEVEILGASGHYPRAVLERIASPAEPLTLAEAAQESGLNVSTLRKQIAHKKLKATKKGTDWLVTRADLMTYLDNRAPSGRPARRKKGRRPKPDARARPPLESSQAVTAARQAETARRPTKRSA